MLQQFLTFIEQYAQTYGGPGLAVIAFFDSSFVSLPEVTDALIVLFVVQHPARWIFYAAAATLGSVAGCVALYSVARRGGERFLQKRFRASHVERGLAVFRRYGLLAVVVPAILPPPMPFKIFVLLSGVARVRLSTFILAVAIGRGFRYGGMALLAYFYGQQAIDFIKANLAPISIGVALTVLVGGVGLIVWRRRHAAPPA